VLPPVVACLVVVATLVGCSPAGRILANEPSARPTPQPATPAATQLPDPQPVVLPRDDAPHDRLTEWWYYTGHLAAGDGRHFGFEFVIFRAERGSFPVTWASHLALTDESGERFLYEQRSEIGPQVDVGAAQGGATAGFSLAIRGSDDRGQIADVPAWTMNGAAGTDSLTAASGAFGLNLQLTDTRAAAVLHNQSGFADFGPAGSTYYYSRPRMGATGTLTLGGLNLAVQGSAWFDHQWGDFIAVGGGSGWDWFAINLDDGTDVMLYVLRGPDNIVPAAYGTLSSTDGTNQALGSEDFSVAALGSWTSPDTGATYPAGWQVSLPDAQLAITLTPTISDQELDTRPTSGVIYWEGSQVVTATRSDEPLGGEAYVELTGYANGQ
jgi:predicted secreted hydrolase